MKNKRFFWKMGVIIMTISTSMGLASCNLITHNRAELASKLLQEKYNQEFETVMIGGSSIATTTFTAYSFLKSNPEIKITSAVDKDGKSIEDDFNMAFVKYELIQHLKELMGDVSFNYEILIYSQFYPSIVSGLNLTFHEWFLMFPTLHYQVFLFIEDENGSVENVRTIYQEFSLFLEKYNYFFGRLRVYSLSPEKFPSLIEKIKSTYAYDTDFFNMVKDSLTYQLEIQDGVISKSIDEFVKPRDGD